MDALKRVENQIELSELEAREHWAKADEYDEQGNRARGTYERTLGNGIMRCIVDMKKALLEVQ